MKTPATDDHGDTPFCATSAPVPADVLVKVDKFLDPDFLTFDAGTNHVYWVACGTDDPICLTTIRGADGGVVAKNRMISNPNALGWGAFWFKPPSDGPLWAEVQVELGTLHWYLTEHELDDYPLPTPITLGPTSRSVTLETDVDNDQFTVTLPAGASYVFTMTTSPGPANVRVDFSAPGMAAPTLFPSGSRTITPFATATWTITVTVISPSDMRGPLSSSFTIQ